MQSGNPNNQGDDLYWQPNQYQKQQYPYQQPQQTRQYAPPPIMPPPKRPWYKRTWTWYRTRSRRTQIIIAAIIVIFIAFGGIIDAMTPAAPSQDSTSTPAPTQQVAQQRLQPTKAPAPNFARLGGTVHDFDLKFGKEDTNGGSIGYQPFGSYTSGQDLPTDKFDISVENGHVEVVRVTLPKESPLSWQDGTKLCQSFLPADAVYLSDYDFSPTMQEYLQLYMSKIMAHMFSADHFVAGNGINPQPLTPGTLQIMYYYSSWYDHTTSGAQITSCDIGLGEKL